MQLFLEPLDVWLFRDGRPFDAGSDHRAQSLFPPYPSVVQGAIRSHQLVLRGVDLGDPVAIAAAVGTADNVGPLRLRGPFVARREGDRIVRYLPQPADAVSLDAERPRLRRATSPRAPDGRLLTSAPTPCLLGLDDASAKGRSDVWLSEENLASYLRGDTVAGVPATELFVRESRFGIGLDAGTRTAQEGALYEAEFIRPLAGVGLLIEAEGYEGWPARGAMRIGGEGRAAAFAQVDAPPWPAAPNPLPRRFTLYFATPACFEGGWQPAGGDWSRVFVGDVRLVAAAVGRYESIGGYDWAARGHKPALRHVPAGSVYHFETDGEARLRADLAQGAVTDRGAAIGFGQTVIGGW